MAWMVLRALLGHWRRHKVELATLMLGLALATALWSGVQALNAEARGSYAEARAVLEGDGLAAIVTQDGGRFGREVYVSLRRQGWLVSPVLEGDIRAGARSLRVIGIDPLTLPPAALALQIGEGGERFTDFVRPPWLALAAPETAAGLSGPGLPPVETSDMLPPDTLLVDIGAAEALLGVEGELSRMLLAPREAGRELPGAFAARLRIAAPGDDGDMERLTASFHLNLTAFGFLSFVVGLFIVYSAIGLAFEQRKPVFRTLRACGVPAHVLAGIMLAEQIAIALIAGVAGVVLGYVMAGALLPDVAASLRGLYGARVPGSLSLEPAWWIAGVAVSILGALAASASSLWRAWRLPLLAAAQPEAWRAAQRRGLRVQMALAACLGLGALALLLFGHGLVAGFTLMGGLLIGGALMLPAILARVLDLLAHRTRGPVATWAIADARQQMSGLSLALMALLLALAVNIGVGTMVESFRRTFLAYLDQRLASELYVYASDNAQAGEVAEWLEARGDVDRVLPIWRAPSRFRDWPLRVYGFEDDATYRANWPLMSALPDAWDRVARGDAILISEQMSRRLGLQPGAEIELPTPMGPWPVTVAAVYPDYGNPEHQMMAEAGLMAAHWPGAEKGRMAVRLDASDVTHVAAALRAEFGLGPDQIIDQRALKQLSVRTFERTFAVTVALNGLTLAVAGVALLTSLLTLANARLVQVAPVWATGLTRRRIAAIELAKTVGLAALTALAALPLGLAVAWVLTNVINVQAFGWQLPVFLYPGQWLGLFVMALLTAIVSSLWPVWRLRRASPLDLLRGFSNER